MKQKGRKNHQRRVPRLFHKPFSSESIDRLRRILANNSRRGEKRFFAIKVDGEFCVYKTNDIQCFDDYQEFIDANTESLEVMMYYGHSNNCNRHLFYLKNNGLNGTPNVEDFEARIKAAQKKEKRKLELKTLKESVKELNEYVDELEALVEKLQQQIEKNNPKSEIAGIIREGIAMFTGLKAKKSDESLSGVNKKEAEVTVEMVDEETSDQEMKKALFDELQDKFGEKGMDDVLGIMALMSDSENFKNGVNSLVKEEYENSRNK